MEEGPGAPHIYRLLLSTLKGNDPGREGFDIRSNGINVGAEEGWKHRMDK